MEIFEELEIGIIGESKRRITVTTVPAIIAFGAAFFNASSRDVFLLSMTAGAIMPLMRGSPAESKPRRATGAPRRADEIITITVHSNNVLYSTRMKIIRHAMFNLNRRDSDPLSTHPQMRCVIGTRTALFQANLNRRNCNTATTEERLLFIIKVGCPSTHRNLHSFGSKCLDIRSRI